MSPARTGSVPCAMRSLPPVRIATLTALVSLAAIACSCSRPAQDTSQGATAVAPHADPSLLELAFPLIDAEGRSRTLAELRGQPFVASMVYTSCTSVCPRVTADLRALESALPPELRARTGFVLFSLDPGRDTPAELTRFAKRHALDRSRWTLLASGEEDMRTLAAVLGVRFRPDAGGEIAHSAVIVVADARGVIRHRQTGLTGSVEPLVAAVREAAGELERTARRD